MSNHGLGGIAFSLEDLMRKQAGGGEEKKPRPLDDAQIMMLREMYDRYSNPCPFKPGDLCTVREGFNHKGVGYPHIVLEVPVKPVRLFTVSTPHETGTSSFGNRLDMRVMSLCDSDHNHYLAFWVESFAFKAWDD